MLDDGFGYEEVDFSQNFSNEEDVTAPEYPPEGVYHLVLQQVDTENENAPGTVFLTFEILAGNVAGQEGKLIRHPIWAVNNQAKNIEAAKKRWQKTVLRLMLALGVRKKGEFPKVKFTDEWWASLAGKQCVAMITQNTQSRTTESGKKVEWINAVIANMADLYPLGDEAVAEIPIDKESAAAGGYVPQPTAAAGI